MNQRATILAQITGIIMASRVKNGQEKAILFIGNSFTARNDLPGMIAQMALTKAINLHHNHIFAGGAPLRRHWNGDQARKTIQEGNYDYVVLQEQSTLPIKNAARFFENVRLFDQEIRSTGAKTVLYMTWARQHSPESQKALTDAYQAIGEELGSIVVPVGTVWQQFRSEHTEPELYDRDRSHPSLAGSYLAACCFIGMLFAENPLSFDCDIPNLPKTHRSLLAKAAWKSCNTLLKQQAPARRKSVNKKSH
jgi:hypothetical protein